jgi:hypothetical protein
MLLAAAVVLHPQVCASQESQTAVAAPGTRYQMSRAAAIKRCEEIDWSRYQTGLLFNPDGYKSYYERSQCLQQAAVEFRDDSLCSQVRERWSMFFSSWAISRGECRKKVAAAVAADTKELEEIKREYKDSPVRLKALRVERNGNGRDFDILPEFLAGYAHGYSLTFEIVGAGTSGTPVVIHSSGYYLDANPNLRIYVKQSDIQQRFPEFALGRPYQVRATVELPLDVCGLGRCWSKEFVERLFPARERTQSMTIETVF